MRFQNRNSRRIESELFSIFMDNNQLPRAILFYLEFILFFSFIWALVWWFRKTLSVNRWELHFIKISGIVFVALHLFAAAIWQLPFAPIYWFGITLIILSLFLFYWALFSFSQPPAVAFANEINQALNIKGPYQLIRHPFYTSYLLAWLGGSFASGCYYLVASFFLMLFIYYRAASEEESQWLESKDAEVYKVYMNKTGMFLPWL